MDMSNTTKTRKLAISQKTLFGKTIALGDLESLTSHVSIGQRTLTVVFAWAVVLAATQRKLSVGLTLVTNTIMFSDAAGICTGK